MQYRVFLHNTNNLQLYGIKDSYLIQIICTQLYGIQEFLSNNHNHMVSSNYFYLIIVICLHTVTWFQVTYNNPY